LYVKSDNFYTELTYIIYIIYFDNKEVSEQKTHNYPFLHSTIKINCTDESCICVRNILPAQYNRTSKTPRIHRLSHRL